MEVNLLELQAKSHEAENRAAECLFPHYLMCQQISLFLPVITFRSHPPNFPQCSLLVISFPA